MLLVASVALAACVPTQTPPPGHVCRHLCGTCDKCTDPSCTDPECADKCKGHGTTGGDDGDTTGGDSPGGDSTGGDSTGGDTTPEAPFTTAAFNGTVLHNGASGTVGEMTLLSNGHGMLTLSNPNSTGYTGAFVNTSITYTVTSSGTFTIWTAPESNIQTPAVGKIEGRTLSVTVTNGLNDKATSYEFKSTLVKVTVKNMYGNNESNVFYYPAGYAVDMSATLAGHTLDYAQVNNVSKTASQLAAFTVPNEDTTVQYYWTVTATSGNYTVIYKPGEGTGTDYVDHAKSSAYKVMSIYAMSSPETEDEEPQYLMNFTPPAGKYFTGWLIEGTSTVVSYNNYIDLTAETTTLVAQWASKITVTLKGLGGAGISGVSTNLSTLGWKGSNAEGFTQDFTPSSNFALPGETGQWNAVAQVSRSGFILVGWQCSEDNVTHAPGTSHVLSQNVTFTAVWQQDTGTSSFDGSYDATTALDLTSWAQDLYVRAVISGRKLTLYTVSNETYVVENLTISGNTATGSNAFFNFTLTLEGNNLTISVKRSGLNTVLEGKFSRA